MAVRLLRDERPVVTSFSGSFSADSDIGYAVDNIISLWMDNWPVITAKLSGPSGNGRFTFRDDFCEDDITIDKVSVESVSKDNGAVKIYALCNLRCSAAEYTFYNKIAIITYGPLDKRTIEVSIVPR